MNLLRRFGYVIAVLLLSQVACQRAARYPTPPASSFRVETLSLVTSAEIKGAFVTTDFIAAVREHAHLGRWFVADDYSPDPRRVAVLGYDVWQRMFGGKPEVLGLDIMLNGRQYTIIGVMPQGFDVPDHCEIWLPDAAPQK